MKNKAYIPYGRQNISIQDRTVVIDVLKSDFITQGPKIEEFEKNLCKYTSAKYAVAVSSGTAALHIACLAADLKRNDEAITSPITFVASANCILYCGGKPIFADVLEDTVNIDPAEIKKMISKKTKVIIPVHFAGHPADLEEIRNLAERYKLIVIEDASHALGAEYKGSKIGSCRYSDMVVFSFHPVKSITTGEGGAVLTNRKKLYERLLMLRNHGITKDSSRFKGDDNHSRGPWYYEQQLLGFNYRITDFQCALGISQLMRINEFLRRRREIVNVYNTELSGSKNFILPLEKPNAKSSWHLYYIRLTQSSGRKIVFERLQKSGIGSQVHYIPVHLQPYYRERFRYREGMYPVAERYYRRTISLPLYPLMCTAEVRKVVQVVRRCTNVR